RRDPRIGGPEVMRRHFAIFAATCCAGLAAFAWFLAPARGGEAEPRGQAAGPGASPPATFLPSRTTPLVALRFIFRVGSQDDPPGKEGLAALTAAMVAEGGRKGLTYHQPLERSSPIAR